MIRSARLRVLVADDDTSTTTAIASMLKRCNLEVAVAKDGDAAWDIVQDDPAPAMAILDWEMPGVTGPDLCRRIRQEPSRAHLHVILLTSRDSRADVVAGLDAGADDYLTKPYDRDELRARVHVGLRIVALQQRLTERVMQLEHALSQVKQLSGLVPICSYCKRIRCDEDFWQQLESYLADHTDAEFTHGICPLCLESIRAEFEELKAHRERVST